VDVDPARRDHQPAGVDFLAATGTHFAHLDDSAVRDRDVGLEGGGAGAVVEGAAADDEIDRAHAVSPGLCLVDRRSSHILCGTAGGRARIRHAGRSAAPPVVPGIGTRPACALG
jgi:hypothetical protein